MKDLEGWEYFKLQFLTSRKQRAVILNQRIDEVLLTLEDPEWDFSKHSNIVEQLKERLRIADVGMTAICWLIRLQGSKTVAEGMFNDLFIPMVKLMLSQNQVYMSKLVDRQTGKVKEQFIEPGDPLSFYRVNVQILSILAENQKYCQGMIDTIDSSRMELLSVFRPKF